MLKKESIKKNEDAKMQIYVRLLKQPIWMHFLSHTIDLTINHAVMSVTPLNIHANDSMIRRGSR